MENVLIGFIIILLVVVVLLVCISKSLLDTFKEMRIDYNKIVDLQDERIKLQEQIIKNYESLVKVYEKYIR